MAIGGNIIAALIPDGIVEVIFHTVGTATKQDGFIYVGNLDTEVRRYSISIIRSGETDIIPFAPDVDLFPNTIPNDHTISVGAGDIIRITSDKADNISFVFMGKTIT